jgi:hypothetical protein
MKPRQEQIQLRAYELFVERGCESGRELDDWLTAEKELTELAAKPELPATEPRTKTAAAGFYPA